VTKEEFRLQEDRERKANWKRWGPISPKGSGAPYAKIIAATEQRGTPFPTIRRAAAPIAGARTVSAGFQTNTSSSASPWPSGTGATRF
jgi:hypothetical protein